MRRTVATLFAASALALAALAFSSPADARREPSAEELDRIEELMRAENFTRWDDIEWNESESVWEVEEALSADGRHFTVKVDRDFRIVERRLDE